MCIRDRSYTAAKGGITALTHALAVSLSGKVRVNSIAPGWIDTWESHGLPEPVYSAPDREQHPSGSCLLYTSHGNR